MGSHYVFDVFAWQPADHEFEELVTRHCSADKDAIMRFHFSVDRRRAFISRLLARKMCREGVRLDRLIDVRLRAEPVVSKQQDGLPVSKDAPSRSHLDRVLSSVEDLLVMYCRGEHDQSTPGEEHLAKANEIEGGGRSSSSSIRDLFHLPTEVEEEEMEVRRTAWRKPYLGKPILQHTNFNFNISHEGRYVVAASDSFALVGVDVAAPRDARAQRGAEEDHLQLRPEWLRASTLGKDFSYSQGVLPGTQEAEREERIAEGKKLHDDFGNCLTAAEWRYVLKSCQGEDKHSSTSSSAGNGRVLLGAPVSSTGFGKLAPPPRPDCYSRFMRIWSLKEAFIKARGDGLGFEIINCSFSVPEEDTKKSGREIAVELRAESNDLLPYLGGNDDWHFEQRQIGGAGGVLDHWISVAFGPYSAIQEEPDLDRGVFKQRFVHHHFTEVQWRRIVEIARRLEFRVLQIDDLLE